MPEQCAAIAWAARPLKTKKAVINSASREIKEEYAVSGYLSRKIFSSDLQLWPGSVPSARVSFSGSRGAGAWYAYAYATQSWPSSSACAYMSVDVTAFNRIVMDMSLPDIPEYGCLMAGLGNFSTYSIEDWPVITQGYAFGAINRANGYYNGQPLQLTIDTSGRAGFVEVGVAASMRSAIGAGGHINISSITLYK